MAADDHAQALTDAQIEEVLDTIPEIPGSCAFAQEYVRSGIVKRYRAILREVNLRPSRFDAFKAKFANRFHRALIEPGTPVGENAAEGISEILTQANLSSFHQAGREGVGNIRTVADIINLNQKPTNTNAYVHLSLPGLSHIDIILLSAALQTHSIRSFTQSVASAVHPRGDLPWYYPLFRFYARSRNPAFEMPENVHSSQFVRLQLKPELLYWKRITTADVAEVIDRGGGTISIFSPAFLGIIDIYPNVENAILSVSKLQRQSEMRAAKGAEKTTLAASSGTTRRNASIAAKRGDTDDVRLDGQLVTPGLLLSRAPPASVNQLFLQNVIARLKGDSLFVSSATRNRAFLTAVEAAGLLVPTAARSLAVFSGVRIVETRFAGHFFGETYDGHVRRLWINAPATANAVSHFPHAKALWIIREVVGPDAVIADNVNDSGCIEVSGVPLSEPILAAVEKRKNDEVSRWNADCVDYAQRYRQGLIPNKPPPRPSEFVLNATNYYIVGMNPVVPALALLLQHPAVDGCVTITNRPREIAAVLGIEPTRSQLFIELQQFIVLSNKYMHPVHINLIVELMTGHGIPIPITPRGNVSLGNGAYPEAAASGLDAFTRSALRGGKEPGHSTAASLIFGVVARLGTGVSFTTPNNPLPERPLVDTRTEQRAAVKVDSSVVADERPTRPDTGDGINAVDSAVLASLSDAEARATAAALVPGGFGSGGGGGGGSSAEANGSVFAAAAGVVGDGGEEDDLRDV